MDLHPSFEDFAATFAEGRSQVVWSRSVADLETPVSAMMKLAGERPNSFLLESVEGGAIRGRYSFIGFDPDVIWRCFGNSPEINRSPDKDANSFEPCPEADLGTLGSLRKLVEESRIDLPAGMPPMAAGLVGFMGYDMVRLAENIPDDNPNTLDLPDSLFLRPAVMAVFDSLEDSLTIVTPVWSDCGGSAEEAYAAARRRLQAAVRDFEAPLAARRRTTPPAGDPEPPAVQSNITREEFHSMVRKAVDYIMAGDAFQIVPSQRFRLPFSYPPFAFYRSLRRLNPSPFLFFLNFGDFCVAGSSPEILVRVRDGRITLRPLAGTRKRGATPEEDRALAEELIADPKERAEHLMLLDLGRNDVGRVAKVGTVTPTEQFIIEYYSHVMHIASNVEGELDPRYDAIDALLAGFPAGTVSGAPKVRAMEIIDELEPERRGVYSGCIGYFGADGDMDTCIALRTAVIKDDTLYVQAGCGVVADSDPEFEYQESVNKAMALVRAAEEAARFSSTKT